MALSRGRESMTQFVKPGNTFQQRYTVVVDTDLSKFFDRVNHNILRAIVVGKEKDKCVLKLIRTYPESGILSNGVVARSSST